MVKKIKAKIENKKNSVSFLQCAAIIEDSHDAIIGKTLDGIITSWNDGAVKMFGYLPDEVIGRSMVNLFSPEFKDEQPRLLEKVRRGEVVADYDSVWLRKDGTRADVEFSISPVRADNAIIGASIVGRDITERKKHEATVQRMSRLYSALSGCNKAIVHSEGEEELFQKVCKIAVEFGGMAMAWVGLLEKGSEQVRPVSWFGAGTEYLKDIWISINSDDLSGCGPTGISIRENHPVWCQDFKNDPITAPWHERAKKFNWCSSAALPLLRNNVPIGCFSVYSNIVNAFDEKAQKLMIEMAMDISFALDNFTNKDKIKKYEESLRQTKIVVESSQDGIFGTSLEGVVSTWNKGAEKMFGYSEEEIVGKSSIILFPPEKTELLQIFIDKIKQKGSVLSYDTIALCKNGLKLDVSLSITPILTDGGVVLGASVVVRDIVARKKAERHIEELNEVRNKFITIISHQLRTPLTAVNWNIEMLLHGDFGELKDIQRKFLQVTHGASTEITHRIHTLLLAMDIEEDRVVFEKEEVAIDSICAAVMEELKNKCKIKNISLEYIVPEKDFPAIGGDSEKIRVVFKSLADNAAVYTKENGSITAKLGLDNGNIRFEIKDNGIGIPESEQHRVFDRFFRASNSFTMEPNSFGLGLFVAKNFIEQYGGKIGFRSKEGEGSIFWFEIPVKLPTESSVLNHSDKNKKTG